MTRQPFDPLAAAPYELSRSGLELFTECERCFYFDRRLGQSRPFGLPFTLNNAVDELLKREFDECRLKREPHPLMIQAGIDAVPFAHPDLEDWRNTRIGIRHSHAPSGFLVYGAVDDIWRLATGELVIVDYKATAKAAEVTELDEEWHGVYKRQIEIYQWLFRRNGFPVSPTAYWVYANGDASAERFDQALRFRMTVILYLGSDDWVEDRIMAARACLMQDAPPPASTGCKYCRFAAERLPYTAQ